MDFSHETFPFVDSNGRMRFPTLNPYHAANCLNATAIFLCVAPGEHAENYIGVVNTWANSASILAQKLLLTRPFVRDGADFFITRAKDMHAWPIARVIRHERNETLAIPLFFALGNPADEMTAAWEIGLSAITGQSTEDLFTQHHSVRPLTNSWHPHRNEYHTSDLGFISMQIAHHAGGLFRDKEGGDIPTTALYKSGFVQREHELDLLRFVIFRQSVRLGAEE